MGGLDPSSSYKSLHTFFFLIYQVPTTYLHRILSETFQNFRTGILVLGLYLHSPCLNISQFFSSFHMVLWKNAWSDLC